VYKPYVITIFLLFFIFGSKGLLFGKVSSVEHFTISQGLSNHSINTVFQDSRGFLWIGTEDGLNRYDGYSFEVIKSAGSGQENLTGNRITALAEDRNGNIWIGTRDNGISVLQYGSGKFKHYTHESGSAYSLPENSISGFYLTASGEMWIKLGNHLARYIEASDNFQSFGHFTNVFKPSDYSGNPIVQETDSTFLVGTKDGLNRFYMRDGVYERLHIYEDQGVVFQEDINHIQEVIKSHFLVATKGGLFLFEPGKSIKKVRANSSFGATVAANAINEDQKGNIWIGTNRGFEAFDLSTLTHRVYSWGDGELESIIPHEITVMFEDASGLFWVGTRFNGLYKVNLGDSKFSFIGESKKEEWPMRSFNISSVYVDRNDDLWLGTLSSGLYKINRLNKTIRHFILNHENYRNGNDAVEALFEDHEGNLWIGSNSGIHFLDINRKVVREFNYTYDTKYTTLLRQNRITAITGDSTYGLWFGTKFGLYRFSEGQLFSYFKGADRKGLVSDEISTLCADKKGNLWIGTNNGISYYDRVSGQIISIDEMGLKGPMDEQVLSLALDAVGRLWVGTRSGLYAVTSESGDSLISESVKAMEDEMITAVLPDEKRRIWVSSSKGVSMYSPEGTIRSFDELDGLPAQLFNPGSAYRAKDGTIYFGSVGGLCWLHPDSIRYNLYQPRIAITGISLCQRGNCEDAMQSALSELHFKYKSGIMLEINYAALEFTQPSKNSYKLMLEGYDDDWRSVTNSNRISFSNLMPGKYKLRIMASNNDFTWNNKPLELPIVISPPLWMTKYAYAFYLLLIIFTMQLLINYRIRHYKKANRSLTEKNVDKQKLQQQREILTRINQNLTDSINYATRIQSAMIPTETVLRQVLPHSFVYFRPRDLVSGDFYWMHERDNKIFVAVVDCTGHGVPGAFMSIIGMDLLKNIVAGQMEDDPSRILEKLSHELDQTLRKNDQTFLDAESIKDGMDMVICVVDKENHTLGFSGAVNGIYLVKNNELHSFKGDRFSIGRVSGGKIPKYTKKTISLGEDDMLYLFTDGYVDQFGGPDHKKFKYRRFRHLLLNIHKLHPDDQKAILHQKMEEWRGEEEQIDDILVLGFKVLN
jgi:ligand-binding sensor domain-containing protein/serine phosphatase RsbU (regulator of sigma subunit)